MSKITAGRQTTEAAKPQSRVRALPTVYASLLAPSGRRTRYALVTSGCPHCSGGRHLHFVDRPITAAERRAGCGHGRYWVQVARTYRHGSPATGGTDRAA